MGQRANGQTRAMNPRTRSNQDKVIYLSKGVGGF
jgi:hypothetical protein